MNFSQHIDTLAAGSSSDTASLELPVTTRIVRAVFFIFPLRVARALRSRSKPKSILRNQTNLPAFLLIALALSLLCNFTLRENTAEASRPGNTRASIHQVLDELRQNPEDYELHSQIGELYFLDRQYRRAMFHLSESNRLIEQFGE